MSQQQCRRGDLSQRRVAAICRIVCLGLKAFMRKNGNLTKRREVTYSLHLNGYDDDFYRTELHLALSGEQENSSKYPTVPDLRQEKNQSSK